MREWENIVRMSLFCSIFFLPFRCCCFLLYVIAFLCASLLSFAVVYAAIKICSCWVNGQKGDLFLVWWWKGGSFLCFWAEEGFLFLGFLLLLFWRLGLVVAEDCYCLVLAKNVKKKCGIFLCVLFLGLWRVELIMFCAIWFLLWLLLLVKKRVALGVFGWSFWSTGWVDYFEWIFLE